ncbi:MAG: hypothetical protein M3O26_01785 [Pseudomonadota bacterium]|nr:hypothetical protein [Pseudomonadota bacterium]
MKFPSLACLASLAAVALAGCCTTPTTKQALDTKAIQAVQADIKRQVGIYIMASKNSVTDAGEFWCGTGNVDFDISTIKAELTTTIETINNAGMKLTIPVSAVTVGSSGSAQLDVTNTQVLTYNLWPLETRRQTNLTFAPTPEQIKAAPIAQVLLSLREALINSARKTNKDPQACFTDYNPNKPAADAGNTFKLGLSFVTAVSGGIEIKVAILDLTASTEIKGTTGNTLTVSFVQRGLAELQRAKDVVDAECKYPKDEKVKSCLDALAAFHKLQEDRGLSAAEKKK